jgi:phosphoribosylformylglycinamidine (FGAM) synthase PurS component
MKERYDRYTQEFGRRLSDAAARAGRKPRRVPFLWHRPALAGLATALALAVAVIATTHSAGRPAQRVASAAGQPPALENEAQAPDAPDEYLDLKQSSAQDVSLAQVRRAQAQAAAVPDASTSAPWSLVGPSNIGGRVVDLVVDETDPSAARAAVERMCEQLLANPLIESYEIELAE